MIPVALKKGCIKLDWTKLTHLLKKIVFYALKPQEHFFSGGFSKILCAHLYRWFEISNNEAYWESQKSSRCHRNRHSSKSQSLKIREFLLEKLLNRSKSVENMPEIQPSSSWISGLTNYKSIKKLVKDIGVKLECSYKQKTSNLVTRIRIYCTCEQNLHGKTV